MAPRSNFGTVTNRQSRTKVPKIATPLYKKGSNFSTVTYILFKVLKTFRIGMFCEVIVDCLPLTSIYWQESVRVMNFQSYKDLCTILNTLGAQEETELQFREFSKHYR